MKTLYVSDLDGTLLNKDATLSSGTIDKLNELMEQGLYFTCATARTYASTEKLLSSLNINMPMILMNGACVYNKSMDCYEKVEYINPSSSAIIIDALNKSNTTGFLYEIKDNKLSTYYENLESKARKDFHDERVNLFQKKFTQVDNFHTIDKSQILYFCILEEKEKTDELYHLLSSIPDIKLEQYKDIYSNNYWYLEIFSVNASKYNAVKYIRETHNFQKVIGFGDNLNDLSLFRACDESYAVANAKDEVKAAATAVIDFNYNDGVASFIQNHFQS